MWIDLFDYVDYRFFWDKYTEIKRGEQYSLFKYGVLQFCATFGRSSFFFMTPIYCLQHFFPSSLWCVTHPYLLNSTFALSRQLFFLIFSPFSGTTLSSFFDFSRQNSKYFSNFYQFLFHAARDLCSMSMRQYCFC